MPSPILEIRNATKIYTSGGFMGQPEKSVVALDNFNLRIDERPATITTIAGESGSGKTTLANLVLGFIRLSSGQIIFEGKDVTNMNDHQLLDYRRNVQAVFQDPFGVYNPFYRVDHVFQLVNQHFKLSDNKTEYQDMVEEGLNVVGLYGQDVLRKYPHQLSGGQRQRIMMARAYMIKPRLIVADEPVSMVDASLRASILDAMIRLRDESNISFLYITHDLSTAYQIGDKIYMLYQGTIAERGNAMDVIDRPQHPYVQLLIDSVPVPDPTQKWDLDISLPSEEEMRTATAVGCRYYPRCPHHMDKCLTAQPPLYVIDGKGHEASCYLYDTNEIAPVLEPILIEVDPNLAVASSNKYRTPAAVIAAILLVGLLVVALAGGGNDATVETVATEDVTSESVVVEATVVEATAASVDDSGLPSVMLTVDDAADKGALEFDTVSAPAKVAAGEKHSYTFEGSAGQSITLQVNARGSSFTSPYAYLYKPDGEFVAVSGDPSKAKRSMRVDAVLETDGSYIIIVGPIDGNGIGEYEVKVEDTTPATQTVEASPVPTVATESELPSIMLTVEDATDKGVLEFDTVSAPAKVADGEKQSYTFEGTAGQSITIQINARGSSFTSPYAYLYSPDGEFVAVTGDPTKAKRSMRAEAVLETDGKYTIIVGPINKNGIGEYEIKVELTTE